MNLLFLLKNKKIQFIFTKYITYFLYFIISILVANKLGLFFFGIYGFFKLLIQYFSYSNLGVNYSGLVIMSEQKVLDNSKNENILSLSLIISAISFLVIFVLFSLICNYIYPYLYEKYNVNEYIFFLFIIILFKQFNQIFINTNRIYDNLSLINWAYIIPCLCELLALLFGNEESLLRNILWAMVISNIFVTILFLVKTPIKIHCRPKIADARCLLLRGIKLLAYNVSFYFIILVSKSFISKYFQVEEFAQYSFSYNLSDAVMLLNNAISFLIYPALLNKLYMTSDNFEKKAILHETQEKYMLIANLIIIVAFIVLPLLHYIVPEYNKSPDILYSLLFAQLLIANTFTLSTNLVQLKKENSLIVIGLGTIIFMLFVNLMLLKLTKNIIVVSYGLSLSLIIYNLSLAYLNVSILKLNKNAIFKFVNPTFFIPFILALIAKIYFTYHLSIIIFIILTITLLFKKYWRLYENIIHEK